MCQPLAKFLANYCAAILQNNSPYVANRLVHVAFKATSPYRYMQNGAFTRTQSNVEFQAVTYWFGERLAKVNGNQRCDPCGAAAKIPRLGRYREQDQLPAAVRRVVDSRPDDGNAFCQRINGEKRRLGGLCAGNSRSGGVTTISILIWPSLVSRFRHIGQNTRRDDSDFLSVSRVLGEFCLKQTET